MPKINFYLLDQDSEEARPRFACRLAEKLLRQQLPVQIYTELEEEALQLDHLLWSFSPESFLPHHLAGTPSTAAPAVLISWGDRIQSGGVLLNLGSGGIPPGPEQFSAIAEFILRDEHSRAQGRELWNRYKQQGWELQHHQI